MNLQSALEYLARLDLTLEFSGFFNVESGFAAVATKIFDYCECSSSAFGEGTCQECSRARGTYVTFPSGNGDGVYVTYKFLNSFREIKGAIAFFDFQYEMANFVRGYLDNGLQPEFPKSLVNAISQARSLRLSEFNKAEKLIFSEATYHQGSEYEPACIELNSRTSFLCYAFCEDVDNTHEGVVLQMQKQGIDKVQAINAAVGAAASFRAVAELSGISPDKNPFPDFRCGAILVIAEGLLNSDAMEDFKINDWKLAEIRARYSSVQTSHKAPMHESTREQNQIWAKLSQNS